MGSHYENGPRQIPWLFCQMLLWFRCDDEKKIISTLNSIQTDFPRYRKNVLTLQNIDTNLLSGR